MQGNKKKSDLIFWGKVLTLKGITIKGVSFFDFFVGISIIRCLVFSSDFMQNTPNRNFESKNSLSHEQIKQIADMHLHQLKKVRRENEKIQSEVGRRTISEILTSKETFYMGACVDSTLSFLFKLKEEIPAEQLELGCELLKQKET